LSSNPSTSKREGERTHHINSSSVTLKPVHNCWRVSAVWWVVFVQERNWKKSKVGFRLNNNCMEKNVWSSYLKIRK
jgi:hypothetical protein